MFLPNAFFQPGRPVIPAACLLAICLLASACSVATPPAVHHIQAAAAPQPTALRIEAAGPGSQQLADALGQALRARGRTVSDGADYALLVAVSQRPASMGLTMSASGAPEKIDWLSRPRKRGLFDACAPQRFDAVITGQGKDAAAPDRRLRGGFDYCTLDPAAVSAQAEAFADKL